MFVFCSTCSYISVRFRLQHHISVWFRFHFHLSVFVPDSICLPVLTYFACRSFLSLIASSSSLFSSPFPPIRLSFCLSIFVRNRNCERRTLGLHQLSAFVFSFITNERIIAEHVLFLYRIIEYQSSFVRLHMRGKKQLHQKPALRIRL